MICVSQFSNPDALVAMQGLLEHTDPDVDINVIVHYHVDSKPIQDLYVGVVWSDICYHIRPLFNITDGPIDVILVYGAMINFAHQDYEEPQL